MSIARVGVIPSLDWLNQQLTRPRTDGQGRLLIPELSQFPIPLDELKARIKVFIRFHRFSCTEETRSWSSDKKTQLILALDSLDKTKRCCRRLYDPFRVSSELDFPPAPGEGKGDARPRVKRALSAC